MHFTLDQKLSDPLNIAGYKFWIQKYYAMHWLMTREVSIYNHAGFVENQ